MHTTHVSSGGRYPVLRSLAILYLVAAVGVVVVGVWRAVNVLVQQDAAANDLFGAPTGMSGRILVAVSWLAATFIGVLMMFGIAELIKLFIDIEHNTRMAADALDRSRATGMSAAIVVPEGAVSGNADGTGGRVGQWLEGEETAEGACFAGIETSRSPRKLARL